MEEDSCGGCGAGQAKCCGSSTGQYCGEKSQRAHWPAHKARCRELKAAVPAAGVEAKTASVAPREGDSCWVCLENARMVVATGARWPKLQSGV